MQPPNNNNVWKDLMYANALAEETMMRSYLQDDILSIFRVLLERLRYIVYNETSQENHAAKDEE